MINYRGARMDGALTILPSPKMVVKYKMGLQGILRWRNPSGVSTPPKGHSSKEDLKET